MIPTTPLWQRFLELYRARHEPEAVRPLFTVVWRALIVCFLLGIVVVVAYATIVFTSVVETVNEVPASTKPATTLDRNALDQAIQKIRARGVLLDIQ